MKIKSILDKLHLESTLNDEEYHKLNQHYNSKLFSVHWELKIILYLGVMLLSTGVGILIYLNIDTIGHTAIVTIIGLASAACFIYSYKNKKPFTWQEVSNDHPFADYILLLGCLLFLSFEGYLQFQYVIFGEHYGLAALIPAVLFFYIAYRYDHKGILSMAITAIGSWLGLTITPLNMLDQDFGTTTIIYTGIILGAVFTSISYVIITKNWKKHFSFTYFNFGMQLLFISTLAGMFTIEYIQLLFFPLLAAICYLAIRYAKKENSFYFLLLAVVYGYIGLTYLFYLILDFLNAFSNADIGIFYLALLYFSLSCAGIIYFFFNYKKILQS